MGFSYEHNDQKPASPTTAEVQLPRTAAYAGQSGGDTMYNDMHFLAEEASILVLMKRTLRSPCNFSTQPPKEPVVV